MRALIRAVEKELKQDPVTSGVKLEAFGPTEMLPEVPLYINIVPRGKSRTRQFLIGATEKMYDAEPEVELHVWAQSMKDLEQAFERCEKLAEDLLESLAQLSNARLGVDWHEAQIEDYNDYSSEELSECYYEAVILLTAKMQESHT